MVETNNANGNEKLKLGGIRQEMMKKAEGILKWR